MRHERDMRRDKNLPVLRDSHWDEGANGDRPKLVVDRVGWPDPGEPISDHIARIALERGRLDIVARYILEFVVPLVRNRERGRIHTTDALYLLAYLLEARPGLDRYLKLYHRRAGPHSNQGIKLIRNLHLGAEIHQMIKGGAELKNAVTDVCARGIGKTKAYEAYDDYRKFLECNENERDEPMPIPDRHKRNRRTKAKQAK